MHETTGVLLAGGRSRRMGTDKRLLAFRGQPLLAHALAQLRLATQRQLVAVASEREAAWARNLLGPVRCSIDVASEAGPLGALVSALPHVASEWAVVLAADMPLVSPELLCHLVERGRQLDVAVVVPRQGERLHVTAAAYHRRVWPHLERAFAEGERSLARAVARHARCEIGEDAWRRFAPARTFVNVNTPADYARLLAW